MYKIYIYITFKINALETKTLLIFCSFQNPVVTHTHIVCEYIYVYTHTNARIYLTYYVGHMARGNLLIDVGRMGQYKCC